MKSGVLLPCLLVLAISFCVAEDNQPHADIALGGISIRLGIAREAAFAALKADKHYIVTKLPDERWVVSDRVANRAVAILTFDGDGRLTRVQKNWTPAGDSGIAFAGTLFDVLEQLQPRGSSGSCTLSASRQLLTGPNTPLRDAGNPDLNVRRIELVCGGKTIEISLEEPTKASTAVADKFLIPAVVLYESIGRGSETASSKTSSTKASAAAPKSLPPSGAHE